MTMDKESKFFKLSREVVCEFLQTTVIVDDEIEHTNSDEKATKLKQAPGRQAATKVKTEGEDSEELVPDDNPNGRILLADPVISGFAEEGIICSVVGPNKDRDVFQKDLMNLTNHADTLVLDWELEKKDNGQLALETLANLTDKSNIYPEQLRLVVIYTGTPDISQVSDKMKEYFGEKIEELENFTFNIGATRVTIYIKGHVDVAPELKERKVNFDQLVDIVIDEFTSMNAGLVSNTVLKALSVVRQNTSKILKIFSSDLDIPYLTHRALREIPDDAQLFLVSLIAEELLAILEETKVDDVANIIAIEAWLEFMEIENITLAYSENIEVNKNDLLDLFKSGLGNLSPDVLSNKKKQKLHELLTDSLNSDKSLSKLDEKFAYLTTMRSYYSKHTPILSLGTIIKVKNKDDYLLCIQPRCDSVRLTKDRDFPFLLLNKIAAEEKRFNLIIKDGDEYERAVINIKPHKLRVISFKPGKNGTINTTLKNSISYFTDLSRKKYIWIGDLKSEQAQRIANQFAAEVARIGLDESEWLRRHA